MALFSRHVLGFALLASALITPPAATGADDDEAYAKLAPFSSCEKVFVAKLTKAIAGPVGLSEPPLYTFRFQFEASEALRGSKPGNETFNFSIRTRNQPVWEEGATYLVGANKGVVVGMIIPTKDDLARVKKVMTLPASWKMVGGQPVSPWENLGDKAWPKDGPKLAETVCAKTGRPALLCGEGIEFKVEQVPAKEPKKFMNDMYGDGKFKLTLTNTTQADAVVPAVLTDGKGQILWADSLFLVQQGFVHLLPGAGQVTKDCKPLTLKAGESVTGEINTLVLSGVQWPTGGQRVYFDFQVGEKSVNHFFYYHFKVHDALREEAQKKLKDK